LFCSVDTEPNKYLCYLCYMMLHTYKVIFLRFFTFQTSLIDDSDFCRTCYQWPKFAWCAGSNWLHLSCLYYADISIGFQPLFSEMFDEEWQCGEIKIHAALFFELGDAEPILRYNGRYILIFIDAQGQTVRGG